MDKKYILVVDAGTTGVRSLIFDRQIKVVSQSYRKITSFYPTTLAVEQNPEEIYQNAVDTIREAVRNAEIDPGEIAGVGITAQRNSWTYWNKKTGEVWHPTVVWSDSRAALIKHRYLSDKEFCAKYPECYKNIIFSDCHGLLILEYLMEEDPDLRRHMREKDTAAGTVNTWLLYRLTGKRVHATGIGHASTTSYFNSIDECWDYETIDYFGLNRTMMAELKSDCDLFGMLDAEILGQEIPICADLADQAAALFSEGCIQPLTAKCTIGTGFFFDVNLGEDYVKHKGLLTAIGWDIRGERKYFIEGYMGSAGAALEWLKNNLNLISDFGEMEAFAREVPDSAGVYFVPALNRMTSVPFRDVTMEGSYMGITAKTNRNHFIRASLEGVAFISAHVLLDTIEVTGMFNVIKIDGGVAKSDLICQILANVTDTRILRAVHVEATAKGAAEMAAIYLGWMREEDVEELFEVDQEFLPDQNQQSDLEHYRWWKKALKRSGKWNDPSDLDA